LRKKTTSNEASTNSVERMKKSHVEAFMSDMTYCAARITIAVIVTFRSASGKSIFQPSRIT